MCNVCSNISASLFLLLLACKDGWECFGGYLCFSRSVLVLMKTLVCEQQKVKGLDIAP